MTTTFYSTVLQKSILEAVKCDGRSETLDFFFFYILHIFLNWANSTECWFYNILYLWPSRIRSVKIKKILTNKHHIGFTGADLKISVTEFSTIQYRDILILGNNGNWYSVLSIDLIGNTLYLHRNWGKKVLLLWLRGFTGSFTLYTVTCLTPPKCPKT